MSEQTVTGQPADAPTADEKPSAPAGKPGDPLPALLAPMPPAAAIERLDRMARRGRLAGFQANGDGASFEAAAFGAPFDRTLVGRLTDDGAGTSRIDFESRIQWKAPLIMIVAIVITIWPGVWLTDSLLVTYFNWYPREFWITAAWYLPLTVLPLPWAGMKIWRQSERAARRSAEEAIGKIATELGGRPDEDD